MVIGISLKPISRPVGGVNVRGTRIKVAHDDNVVRFEPVRVKQIIKAYWSFYLFTFIVSIFAKGFLFHKKNLQDLIDCSSLAKMTGGQFCLIF